MNESKSPSTQNRIEKNAFLKCVRASGLISGDRLAIALQQMPDTDRAKVIARGLVEQGLLTKFQAQRLLAGRTDGFLLGQYRILDELGRGGMGHVFKAEHMTMGRTVALKVLNSNLLKTERARQLFHREVKAAAKLSHPNIVTAYDANQVNDRCFLVMEYVDGPNLHDLVKDRGPLPVSQACDYVRQTAIGLNYAHDIGMVHRDIKPANLLVQTITNKSGASTSIVKILDFGLARISSPDGEKQDDDSIEAQAKTVMGTPDYLSPEQARSLHGVDGRADIYSLGCTLYCLLTGEVPFKGGAAMEKLIRHTTEDAAPVNSLRPEVPAEVVAIVQKMMAKKPEDRYQSGAELAEALLPFCTQPGSGWIPVEPNPSEPLVPVSSRSLPRIPVPAAADPFANLDESYDDASEHGVGTLSGEGAITDLAPTSEPATVSSSGYRRRPAGRSDNSPLLAIMIILLILLGFGALIYFVLRPLLLKSM